MGKHQTCVKCDSLTGRCNEDALVSNQSEGPLCEDCFDEVNAMSPERSEADCPEAEAISDEEIAELKGSTGDSVEWGRVQARIRTQQATLDAQALEGEALNAKFKEAFNTDHMISEDYVNVTRENTDLRTQLAEAREDVERWRLDHGNACQLVAEMHAAAVGEVTGPKRGVVEDVADVRTQLAEAREDARHYGEVADRANERRVASMKEDADTIVNAEAESAALRARVEALEKELRRLSDATRLNAGCIIDDCDYADASLASQEEPPQEKESEEEGA